MQIVCSEFLYSISLQIVVIIFEVTSYIILIFFRSCTYCWRNISRCYTPPLLKICMYPKRKLKFNKWRINLKITHVKYCSLVVHRFNVFSDMTKLTRVSCCNNPKNSQLNFLGTSAINGDILSVSDKNTYTCNLHRINHG